MYRPKYLGADELVWKDLYVQLEKQKRTDRIFWQFNPLVLMTADLLREKYGAITVNNWSGTGSFQNRGLRPDDSSVGAALSAHKRGAALDCNFRNASAEEIRQDMKKAGCFKPGFKNNVPPGYDCFKYINRVESTLSGKPISWFHFDIFNCYNPDGSIIELHV